MQFAPNIGGASFTKLCGKETAECVLEELSDGSGTIGGVLVENIIVEIEEDKDTFGGQAAAYVEKITVYWDYSEQPNARSTDHVIIGDQKWKIKSGFPIRTDGCWMMAEVSECRS